MIMNAEDPRKYSAWIYFQPQASSFYHLYLTSNIKNDKTKRKH